MSRPIGRLRRQVAFDRLLARLFQVGEPLGLPWVLKGGYAMELRIMNYSSPLLLWEKFRQPSSNSWRASWYSFEVGSDIASRRRRALSRRTDRFRTSVLSNLCFSASCGQVICGSESFSSRAARDWMAYSSGRPRRFFLKRRRRLPVSPTTRPHRSTIGVACCSETVGLGSVYSSSCDIRFSIDSRPAEPSGSAFACPLSITQCRYIAAVSG